MALASHAALAGGPPMAGMPRLSTLAAPGWDASGAGSNAVNASDASSSSNTSAAANTAGDSPTMARIRERGRILLGYRQTAIPFSYVDAQDQPAGLAWALCQRIVLALQREMAMPALRITPVRVIEQMRGPLVKADAIDIDCAPSTVTAAREQQVAFSLPYYAAHVRLLVRRGAGIESIDDLRGLRLVVVQGTTAERLVRARHAGAGFQLLMARDYDDAFRMLRQRRAQALALDDVLLEGLRATSKTPHAYRIVGEPLSDRPEYYALVLPKDDPVFKDKVDTALAALFRRAEMARLQRESFQTALSPHRHGLAPEACEASAQTLALWAQGASYGATQEAGASSSAAGS